MVDFAEFKKFFLFNLIGSLIISALVAVVTVLIGTFNDITARVLWTLFMVMLHSLISLAFIWDNDRQKTFDRLAFFINVLFFIIILSFITSLFGIWKVIPGELVWKLYQSYFVIGFAALHADILSKATEKEHYLDVIVYLNYAIMAIVVLMLMVVVYTDNATVTLGEFYFRLLGAAGIVDGTLSILTIIFYKLYMNAHPKSANPLQNVPMPVQGQKAPKASSPKGLSPWVWILIIYLVFQIGSFVVMLFLRKY